MPAAMASRGDAIATGSAVDADLARDASARCRRARAPARSGRCRAGRQRPPPRRDGASGRRSSAWTAPDTPRASRSASPTAAASRTTSEKPRERRPTMWAIIDLERHLGQRRGDDVPAVAQDGGAVGDAEDLVHAVRDVDDCDALRLEPADIVEQAVDLVRRQRRRRLVEHQDAWTLRGRLDDLGELPLASAKICDLRRSGRCRRRASAKSCARRLAAARSSIRPAPSSISRVEEDVLRHRQRRERGSSPGRSSHAGGAGGLRREGRDRMAVDLHRAAGSAPARRKGS